MMNNNEDDKQQLLFDSDSMLSPQYSNPDEVVTKTENNSSQDEATLEKKRGRPKGRKTQNNPSSAKKTKKVSDEERLPHMKANVHKIKLTDDKIEEYKKSDSGFPQPGVCFVIAAHLDACVECARMKGRGKKPSQEVDCRFYQFRKLRYDGDKLIVAGFPDPFTDPREIDISIWMPQQDKFKFKSLSAIHARLIIAHVGDELCRLIEKERMYFNKFKSSSKPLIWKRPIERVLEICDLCSTTLFNYHFICSKCGLSLCVDCVNEKNKSLYATHCSLRDDHNHNYEDIHLTQIIPTDCMDKLQRMLHDICIAWSINHECNSKTEPILELDRTWRAVIHNILIDGEVGKNFMHRELKSPFDQIDIDLTSIKIDEVPNLHDECIPVPKSPPPITHKKTVRYITKAGKENVISISRSMSQVTSELFYNVPHKWLCENKLLRLLDPQHPKNEEFFYDQWQRGQPVLISNVLDHFNKEHWLPQSFSNEFGSQRSDFINCMNGNLVRNKEIAVFWDGFEIVEKRLKDNEGKPMLLKLKDWPPDRDFKNIMPSRFEDIMKNLPVNAYTNRTGDLNIVKYLPSCFIHPDLGPKGYFAYGSPYYLKEGTTNLHLDIADACNVMCYIGFPRDNNHSMDDYIMQGFQALLESDADASNIDRVIRDGEIPGAIWHIYEATDTDRIRDFLLKIASEKGFQVAEDHDVIHDQNWYLDGELRKRLNLEYGVKGYAIIQCLGDCIILPGEL